MFTMAAGPIKRHDRGIVHARSTVGFSRSSMRSKQLAEVGIERIGRDAMSVLVRVLVIRSHPQCWRVATPKALDQRERRNPRFGREALDLVFHVLVGVVVQIEEQRKHDEMQLDAFFLAASRDLEQSALFADPADSFAVGT